MNSKKILWVLFLILVLTASCIVYIPTDEGGYTPRPGRTYDRDYDRYGADIDVSYFHEYLSPYGVWVYEPPYGYVWIPRDIPYRWRPYTHGRWVWTDWGWTWFSYFDWGWVPFHYGRWGWDRYLGWFWVPGTIWGPAWVTWRWGDLYIGWAPLPPDVEFVMGMGLTRLPYDLPQNYWIFIEGRYFHNSYLDRYVLPYERNLTIMSFTVHKTNIYVRNNRVINEGIDLDQVRRITRTEVHKYQLQDADRPGRPRLEADELTLYRPTVKKNEAAKPKSVLGKEEAREKISRTGLGEPRGRIVRNEEGSQLKEEQQREKRLLEESQEEDAVELKRKLDEEKRIVKDPAEQEKVEKDYKVKAQELKKRHEEEKSELEKRHKEEEKVVKGKIKKKDSN